MDVEELRRVGICPMMFQPTIKPLQEQQADQANEQSGGAQSEQPFEESWDQSNDQSWWQPVAAPEKLPDEPPKKLPDEPPKKPPEEQLKVQIIKEQPPATPIRFSQRLRRSSTRFNGSALAIDLKNLETPDIKNSQELKIKKVVRLTASAKKISRKQQADLFRDKCLTRLNTKTYHDAFTSPEARDIVQLAHTVHRSQVDKFTYDSRKFIVISFLTAARIFEFSKDSYHEVKRIPTRFVSISPRLITSIHHVDSKFYIAFLWGSVGDKDVSTRPYIEVRGIDGSLIYGPHYYDMPVQQIYSDRDFVYVRTRDIVYIHRKDYFSCIHYKCELGLLSRYPIVGTWVDSPQFGSFTKLPLITASTNEILVINHDVIRPAVQHCFRYMDDYFIVSIDKLHKYYVVHRNAKQDQKIAVSKIDLGCLCRLETKTQSKCFFALDTTFSFDYKIVQVRVMNEVIYVLGRKQSKYELGSIYTRKLKPFWVTTVEATKDDECHFLVQDDHIAIVRKNQEIDVIDIAATRDPQSPTCDKCKVRFLTKKDLALHYKNKHRGIFKTFTVSRNKFLHL